jgi:hypothetical protein
MPILTGRDGKSGQDRHPDLPTRSVINSGVDS